MSTAALAIEWFIVGFLLLAYLPRVALILLAIPTLRRRDAAALAHGAAAPASGFEPPVSVVIPAGSDDVALDASLGSALALDYPQYEVVVICDGEAGPLLSRLQAAFDLEPVPEAYWRRIPTQPLRAAYRSRSAPALRVLDKPEAGVPDALNAAINASRFPFFCPLLPGWTVQDDALRRVTGPLLDDPHTTACGAILQPLPDDARAPDLLAQALLLASWRDALARVGWAALDALLGLERSLAVLRKDCVVEAGGYREGAPGEDLEITVRLHRALAARGERCTLHFVPHVVGAMRLPVSLAGHAEHHARGQRELARGVLFEGGLSRARGSWGARGLGYPFALAVEGFGPPIEVAAYAFMAVAALAGLVPAAELIAFLMLAIALGFLHSAAALLVAEASLRPWPPLARPERLALAALLENFGYRQSVAFWRARGLIAYLRSR